MCERVGMSDRKINRERKREVLRVTNFANEIIIFIHDLSLKSWIEFQRLQCIGIAAIAVAEIKSSNEIILVGASYHNQGWETKSPVFKMNTENVEIEIKSINKFIQIQ